MFLAKVTSLVPGAESIRWTVATQEAKEILEFLKILKMCSTALQWAGLASQPKPDFNNKLSTKMQNLHILFSSIRLFTIFLTILLKLSFLPFLPFSCLIEHFGVLFELQVVV